MSSGWGKYPDVMGSQGYLLRHVPDHPRSYKSGYIPVHILVAEKALGKYMPDGSEVHHVNSIRSDNKNTNLVICQDLKYHKQLHQRQAAFTASGNANYRKCFVCKIYSDQTTMKERSRNVFSHPPCYRSYARDYKARKKVGNVKSYAKSKSAN